MQLTTNPAFPLTRKHLLLYLPAFIQILVDTFFYITHRLTGSTFQLLDNKPWFFFTELLPIIGMSLVLFIYGKKLVFLSKQLKEFSSAPPRVYLFKLYSFLGFLVVLTLL